MSGLPAPSAINARLFMRSVLALRHWLHAELLRLAARIGCRREQVNREVRAMVQDGLAEKVRGGLVPPRPALLEQRLAASLEQAG